MSKSLTNLEQTFLDLAAIDEVYPNEDKVLTYVTDQLAALGLSYTRDKTGNIVALLGDSGPSLALVGHVDIAAPLAGRQVVVTKEHIKTDGRGLLGADDKAAVALMLELARAVQSGHAPSQPIELIFTIGEEAGCLGAAQLDLSRIRSKQALVLDWLGGINEIVTKSPAYIGIDVSYTGRDAHPAEWQEGKNAGAGLAEAVAGLKQGEYEPDVTCNVGVMQFGEARNKVPGRASLLAEMRSFDGAQAQAAAAQVAAHFHDVADKHDLAIDMSVDSRSPSYVLNTDGPLYRRVGALLDQLGLKPHEQPTYGCFDGNDLANRGLEVIMMGAGYYNPHSPSEYLDRAEFAQAFEFLKLL